MISGLLSMLSCTGAVAPKAPTVLMVGDSLLYGTGGGVAPYDTDPPTANGKGGWRSVVQSLAYAANKAPIAYVGSLAAGVSTVSGKYWSRQNEGWGGYSFNNFNKIGPVATAAVAKYSPTISVLHCGLNDVPVSDWTAFDAAVLAVYNTLLSPAGLVRLFVCLPPPRPVHLDQNPGVLEVIAHLSSIAATLVAGGAPITLIDLFTPTFADPNFEADYLIPDSQPFASHGNDAGYAFWGGIIYPAMASYLV